MAKKKKATTVAREPKYAMDTDKFFTAWKKALKDGDDFTTFKKSLKTLFDAGAETGANIKDSSIAAKQRSLLDKMGVKSRTERRRMMIKPVSASGSDHDYTKMKTELRAALKKK